MPLHFSKRLALSSVSAGFLGFAALLMTPSWSQTGAWPDGNATPRNTSNPAIAPAQVVSNGGSMMASVILANGFQQIAVLDHAKATMAVYHIDPSSGDIQLKSVRRLDADFSLEEFNLSEPTPSTIRKNVR
jgi:hypothetical protein